MSTFYIYGVEPTPGLLKRIYDESLKAYKTLKNENIVNYLEKSATGFLTGNGKRHSDYLELTNNFAPWQKIVFAYVPHLKRLGVTPINHALSKRGITEAKRDFEQRIETLVGEKV